MSLPAILNTPFFYRRSFVPPWTYSSNGENVLSPLEGLVEILHRTRTNGWTIQHRDQGSPRRRKINMTIHNAFPSPFCHPLQRRFVILGLSAALVVMFLHIFAPTTLPPALTPNHPHHEPDASYFSPSKWIPPILNPNSATRPVEFDEDGQCLFVSPFDALSAAEKARARFLQLEEVSSGVFRSKPLAEIEYYDHDDESGFGNDTTVPNGLTHPILTLLMNGEIRWKARMARQSTTLERAVDVYREKWGRMPPKGFDEWYVAGTGMIRSQQLIRRDRWRFAMANQVLLPDEYDA